MGFCLSSHKIGFCLRNSESAYIDWIFNKENLLVRIIIGRRVLGSSISIEAILSFEVSPVVLVVGGVKSSLLVASVSVASESVVLVVVVSASLIWRSEISLVAIASEIVTTSEITTTSVVRSVMVVSVACVSVVVVSLWSVLKVAALMGVVISPATSVHIALRLSVLYNIMRGRMRLAYSDVDCSTKDLSILELGHCFLGYSIIFKFHKGISIRKVVLTNEHVTQKFKS